MLHLYYNLFLLSIYDLHRMHREFVLAGREHRDFHVIATISRYKSASRERERKKGAVPPGKVQDLSKRNNITRCPIPVHRTHACVLGNRDALGGERVARATCKHIGSGSPMHGTWSFLFLLSGVVGARNLTMECRKGRRKEAPILVGLLLAWLLTNGCAVVARNIGEYEEVFTILDRGFMPRVNPLSLSLSPSSPFSLTEPRAN